MARLITLLYILLSGIAVSAHDLQLTQLQVVDQQKLSVELSWSGSWRLEGQRAPFNHDAVWLFAKYRNPGGEWQHLNLSTQDSDFFLDDTSLEVKAVSDGKGVFVRRATAGEGQSGPARLTFSASSPLPDGYYDLQVYGVEMVFITGGSFWLGDSSSVNTLRKGDILAPFQVGSESTISAGNGPDQLTAEGDAAPAGDLPAAYPKGFDGFYVMKYELGQEQYADFLNTLTYAQQAARTAVSPDAARGTLALAPTFDPARNGLLIEISGTSPSRPARYACEASADGDFFAFDDGQTRACNYLSWYDLIAYLDWAGLRPLTELEFEKASRGPVYPVPGAFAWGTPSVVDANTVVLDGTENESVTEQATSTAGLASHGYVTSGLNGPLRAGFGGSAASERLQAGGSYYGVWELSGNVWELCVSLDSVGLAFTGQHGDGELTPDGEADVAGWPGDGAGAGHKGGAFNSGIVGPFRDLAVSDRFYIGLFPSARRSTGGGRGVRSGL